jgi:hypothetical protein
LWGRRWLAKTASRPAAVLAVGDHAVVAHLLLRVAHLPLHLLAHGAPLPLGLVGPSIFCERGPRAQARGRKSARSAEIDAPQPLDLGLRGVRPSGTPDFARVTVAPQPSQQYTVASSSGLAERRRLIEIPTVHGAVAVRVCRLQEAWQVRASHFWHADA